MKTDIDTIPNLYSITGNVLDINTVLINREELRKIVETLEQDTKIMSNMRKCFVKEYSNKRDIKEYLENILDSIDIFLGTCYIEQGETPEHADQGFHDSWAEKSLRAEVSAARKLMKEFK